MDSLPEAIPSDAPPPSPHFDPPSADALWQLINSPHPVVGAARHLGEALVNAGMVRAAALAAVR